MTRLVEAAEPADVLATVGEGWQAWGTVAECCPLSAPCHSEVAMW